ncbi:MmcQ/YjbR family DNA-binding protein [Chitinimonas sp. BJYL2]|uniref:MmcQ/YjbR family DNA-binding protein n=1 Tax=Chitinimonas sp. BJYL2 TaxID=2976696 RepID=UPI0022B443EF|nr:MmcQ/YjbR family DNA-binding protein [Chitinimonas sp. BJYL2]
MTHQDIEAYCMALPGVTADIKWQSDRVFSVGAKMFCVMCADPAQSTALSFKVDPQRYLELTDQPGIVPAPYLARHHWVQLDHPSRLPTALLKQLLTQSHQLVVAKLPKKQQSGLTLASDIT